MQSHGRFALQQSALGFLAVVLKGTMESKVRLVEEVY